MRRRAFVKGLAASAAFATLPVAAERNTTQLVLGFDISSSMFYPHEHPESGERFNHWGIQLTGHIKALMHEEVTDLLIARRTHLSAYTWAEELQYVHTLAGPLQVLRREDVIGFCTRLQRYASAFVSVHARTNHGIMPEYVLKNIPKRGVRNILDISTDERVEANHQERCFALRQLLERSGWTVNAIAIDDQPKMITRSMERFVITKDGFVETSFGWKGYAAALKRKLKRELMVS